MKRIFAGVVLVCAGAAQVPRIGDIDFYGLRKITPEQIFGATGIAPGDTLPASKGNLEDQIADLPGVAVAHVEAVCCEGSRSTLFIGIAEEGEPQPAFHSPPAGQATLPQAVMDSYREHQGAELRAQAKGVTEDLTTGAPLSAEQTVRGFQTGFTTYAASHVETLRAVLRSGAEPEERAAAATVIGYARDKKAVVDDLQYAILDADEHVRSNSLRALVAVAVLAQKRPQLGIRLSPSGFVDLLSSAVLSDRLEATKALLTLTDGGRNGSALNLIRELAMPSLAEMARWKTAQYALPPFLLIGRVAALTDAQAQQRWDRGDREAVIQKALEGAANKHRP